jgi:hypothetical protein
LIGDEKMTPTRLNWLLPLCGLVAAIIAVLPRLIFGEGLASFGVYAAAVLLGLILLVVLVATVRRHALAAVSMAVIFCATGWLLYTRADDTVWLFRSQIWQARVLAKPTSTDGTLKHAEWDAWGFAGVNNMVYLVFDPSNSLAPAARGGIPGKFSGLPCAVVKVHRLESHWYFVRFYTDTNWEYCPN